MIMIVVMKFMKVIVVGVLFWKGLLRRMVVLFLLLKLLFVGWLDDMVIVCVIGVLDDV